MLSWVVTTSYDFIIPRLSRIPLQRLGTLGVVRPSRGGWKVTQAAQKI